MEENKISVNLAVGCIETLARSGENLIDSINLGDEPEEKDHRNQAINDAAHLFAMIAEKAQEIDKIF
jgi:hypothetical protein